MGMYNDGCESTVIMVRQQQKQKDQFELRRYFRNEIINAKTGPNNNKQTKNEMSKDVNGWNLGHYYDNNFVVA